MLRSLALAGFLTAVVTSPVVAEDKKAADPAEKKICRQEVATGSVMMKRVCHTKAEWDAIAAASSTSNHNRDADQLGARSAQDAQLNR